MKRFSACAVLLIMAITGCDNSIDKSVISPVEKLTCPNGQFTLYRYFVESSMAFGSGFSVIKILDSKERCDFTDRDFFSLDNNWPFFIKWKSNDTLIVKCTLYGAGLSDKQPVKKEIKKWKDWLFEVEYYSNYSSSGDITYRFDSYSISNDFIIFKSKKDSVIFKKDEVQISLDTNSINLTQFKIDTFNSKLGLSLLHYKFINTYNKNDFLRLQSFSKIR